MKRFPNPPGACSSRTAASPLTGVKKWHGAKPGFPTAVLQHITSQTPSVIYCWSSCNPKIVCLFKYKYDNNFVSFRCERPQKDDAEDNPHFWFHVEASYNNLIYDPSYGMTGMATFTEMTPVTANHPKMPRFQCHLNLPIYDHTVGWVCPH